MRRAAAAAVLLAAAASLFADEDRRVELAYEFGAGEAAAAAKVIARRLELIAIEGAEAEPLEDGKPTPTAHLPGRSRH